MRAIISSTALAILAATGCADEFTEYNRVEGLRILAVRAEPPDLRPGEQTALDLLVTTGDAAFSWSWCPLLGAAGECAVTEDELRALAVAEEADPEDIPPFDLGSDPTALFTHTIPIELIAAVCDALAAAELPEGTPRPRCDGVFDVSVRVEVSGAGESILAVRDLGLIYEEGIEPNANPVIRGGDIFLPGGEVRMPLGGAETPQVGREVEHQLELEISDADAEIYEEIENGETVPAREALALTWFFESGEMDKSRSSFLEGVTDLANLRTNFWTTPAGDELEADLTRLFFVLRDDRGGLDFSTAEVGLR